MKKLLVITATLLILLSAAIASTEEADGYAKTIELFKKSPEAMPFFETAYGFAVFPTIGKGGLIFGVAAGEGRVYQQGAIAGKAEMVKVSVGAQIGGQAFSQIIFFKDERAYREFTSGEFTFRAGASAVAVTAAAQAQTGSTGNASGSSAKPSVGKQSARGYKKGMAVFIRIKGGMMHEAAIGGQKFNFNPLK